MYKINVRKAFTLIELLLVVIIIGVLAAIMVPSFSGRSEEARKARAKTEIESTLGLALDMYEADIGSYPSTEQGLDALIIKPEGVLNWRGPYIKKSNRFEDPWENIYQYQFPGQQSTYSYDLISPGKDGQVGTDDDISNFDEDQQNRTQ